MNIEQAKEIISVDRVLLIAIISVLIENHILATTDINKINHYCKSALDSLIDSRDAVLQVRTEEVRRGVTHFLASFIN